MAGTKLLHEFVQGRNQRSNAFINQTQALSGAVPEEVQRRQAIAAGARVPVLATKLHAAPTLTRPQHPPLDNGSPNIGPSQRQNSLRSVRIDRAGDQQGQRDVYDTDVEDLTESLFSDPSQQGDQLPATDRGPQNGVTPNGVQVQPASEKDRFHVSGRLLPQQRSTNHLNDGRFRPREDLEHSESDSDASEDVQPRDNQTLTFTPEQAARVQDFNTHVVQVVERPKSRVQNANVATVPRNNEGKDLYDLSLQRAQSGNQGLNRLSSADDAPANNHYGFRRIASADEKDRQGGYAGSHEPRKTEALHRIPTSAQHGKGLFEPSNAAEDEDDVSEPDSRIDAGTPSPPPAAVTATSANAGALVPVTSLDYSPEVLAGMTYDRLASQPFDTNPNPPASVLPPSHIGAPLSTQLAYVVNLPSPQQTQFCASVTASQWEDCGDWFVEQFAFLTGKMKEARREKRRVATAFEDEIAARERVVRAKTEGFEKVLEGMRRGGQGLLGRDPA